MTMLDKFNWQAVVIIVAALAAIVVLALAHADTGVILSALAVMGLGGGIGMLSGIKTNVNGNVAKMIDLLQNAVEKLAQAQAIPAQPPVGPDASKPGT